MESSGGWQFWLEESGCVRQVMVAEPDEIKARERLRKERPKGKYVVTKNCARKRHSDSKNEARRALQMGCQHSERRYPVGTPT